LTSKDNKVGPASVEFKAACNLVPMSTKETAAAIIGFVAEDVALPVATLGVYTGNPVLTGAGGVGFVGGAGVSIALDKSRTMDEKQLDALAAARFTDCTFTDTYRSVHGNSASVSVLDAARDPQTFAIVSKEMTSPSQQKYLKEFETLEKERLSALASSIPAVQTQNVTPTGPKTKPSA
jgi:hypothetical protein